MEKPLTGTADVHRGRRTCPGRWNPCSAQEEVEMGACGGNRRGVVAAAARDSSYNTGSHLQR